MPKFGRTSNTRKSTVVPPLQMLFDEVIKRYDCAILCGYRNKEAQDKAYAEKKSKVEWPLGGHNTYPSKAIDVAPWDVKDKNVDWKNIKAFYHFAGYVRRIAEEMDIEVRWGGDWDGDYDLKDQKFNDLVHWEVVE